MHDKCGNSHVQRPTCTKSYTCSSKCMYKYHLKLSSSHSSNKSKDKENKLIQKEEKWLTNLILDTRLVRSQARPRYKNILVMLRFLFSCYIPQIRSNCISIMLNDATHVTQVPSLHFFPHATMICTIQIVKIEILKFRLCWASCTVKAFCFHPKGQRFNSHPMHNKQSLPRSLVYRQCEISHTG